MVDSSGLRKFLVVDLKLLSEMFSNFPPTFSFFSIEPNHLPASARSFPPDAQYSDY
jgi:hypothetical protein